ncbi:MAG: TIGR04149 family rSAM-modified RiPP [Prevotellaceae bacterium]|jgi:natural product precursor|nr:TIGR04149 family rSAM-modified RiPP [Prevotellaceae bacterium]
MKNKKLSLNKEVIASFDNREINRFVGGDYFTILDLTCHICHTSSGLCTDPCNTDGVCGMTDYISCPGCWTAGGGAPTAGPPTCECSDICGSPTIPTEFCPTNPQICIV